ncbi:hypothetical protein GCM10009801_25530 [Streptomyces albiaxialis]|uniref:Uncharacterized protein n=1 Tax=Streptomyces albiaxialis TaxID=329523 RepID=A0ABN2VU98_9ACTN
MPALPPKLFEQGVSPMADLPSTASGRGAGLPSAEGGVRPGVRDRKGGGRLRGPECPRRLGPERARTMVDEAAARISPARGRTPTPSTREKRRSAHAQRHP